MLRVVAQKFRTRLWRPDHAGVQHAGQFEIDHIGVFSRDLLFDILARQRFADQLIQAGILGFYLAAQLDIEALAANQLGIAHAPLGRTDHADRAIGRHQFFGRNIETLGGHRQQGGTRFSTGVAQRTAAVDDAIRGAGTTLVRGGGRVAHMDGDRVEGYIELLGHDLRK